MKLLLDEQLSPQIAATLRESGIDAVAVKECSDLIGLPDAALFDTACRDGRVVVTNNIKDFRPLAAQRLATGRTHPGLILLPSTRSRSRHATATLAAMIADVVKANPTGLDGAEAWIASLTR